MDHGAAEQSFLSYLFPSLDGKKLVHQNPDLVESQERLQNVLVGSRHSALMSLQVKLRQPPVLFKPAEKPQQRFSLYTRCATRAWMLRTNG